MGEFDITEGIADSTGVYVPENYTSGFKAPVKGGTYVDSKFGTTIKRLTDGWTDASPPQGYTGEYSQRPHLNINSTRLLVTESITGGFRVIDTSTLKVTNTPGIAGADEPMWDGIDPDIIWYNSGNQIKKYNCATGVTTVVATFNGAGGFPNFSSIEFGGGSSDMTDDNDHIGVLGDGRHGLVYKISTNEVGPVRDFGANEDIGSYNVTADNNVLVGFNTTGNIAGTVSIISGSTALNGSGTSFTAELQPGSVLQISGRVYNVASVSNNTMATLETPAVTTASGVTANRKRRHALYNKNMVYVRVVCQYSGHNTYGRDPSTGDEVFLVDAAGSEVGHPAGCGSNGLVKFLMKNGTSSCLVGFPDFNLTGHYSWSNTRGSPWVALSLYDGRTSSSGTARMNAILRSDWSASGIWRRFYNELLIVNIVTGEIRRLAHLRIRITGILGYWFTSRAAISKDAAYITFSSAMGEYRHKTGAGTVSTTPGSPTVTGIGTPFVSSTASVIHGGEITIGGVTKNISSIADKTHLDTDTNWAANNSGVPYTAQNPDITDVYRVTLRAEATDFTAPVISDVKVSNITPTSATISWTTDKPSTSQVEWGTLTYYGGGITPYNPEKVTSHSVDLTRLPSNKTIHFRVKSRDNPGNIKLSPDQTFFTGDSSTVTPTPIPPAPTNTPSPDGTEGPTVTDSEGAVWTLGPLPASRTLRNGVDVGGAGKKYLYWQKVVYVQGMSDGWFRWTGTTWVQHSADRPPAPAPIVQPAPLPTPVPIKDEYVIKTLDSVDAARTSLLQEMWKLGYGAYEETKGVVKFRLFPKP